MPQAGSVLTMPLSRRRVMSVTAILPLGLADPSGPTLAGPMCLPGGAEADPLLELEQLYVASADASNAAHALYSDAEDDGAHPAEIARLQRESDRLLAEYMQLADRMTDAVPVGPAGVAVKARRLLESHRMGDDGSEEGNILSILAWAAAATGAPQDGPMIIGSERAEEE